MCLLVWFRTMLSFYRLCHYDLCQLISYINIWSSYSKLRKRWAWSGMILLFLFKIEPRLTSRLVLKSNLGKITENNMNITILHPFQLRKLLEQFLKNTVKDFLTASLEGLQWNIFKRNTLLEMSGGSARGVLKNNLKKWSFR